MPQGGLLAVVFVPSATLLPMSFIIERNDHPGPGSKDGTDDGTVLELFLSSNLMLMLGLTQMSTSTTATFSTSTLMSIN